jgi:hypothetical protein
MAMEPSEIGGTPFYHSATTSVFELMVTVSALTPATCTMAMKPSSAVVRKLVPVRVMVVVSESMELTTGKSPTPLDC